MPLAVLVSTSRVAAEATVGRLAREGIEAQVLEEPNFLVKGASGGNYRVKVAVPEEELARAREALACWEVESRPRVESLGREVRRGLLLSALPALALVAWLCLRAEKDTALWIAVVPTWLVGLFAWAAWSRWARRAR